jgi:hypothetical protein
MAADIASEPFAAIQKRTTSTAWNIVYWNEPLDLVHVTLKSHGQEVARNRGTESNIIDYTDLALQKNARGKAAHEWKTSQSEGRTA